MRIRVTTVEGKEETVIVNGPNQRDAKLIAMREVTGFMVPPEGTFADIIDLYAHKE